MRRDRLGYTNKVLACSGRTTRGTKTGGEWSDVDWVRIRRLATVTALLSALGLVACGGGGGELRGDGAEVRPEQGRHDHGLERLHSRRARDRRLRQHDQDFESCPNVHVDSVEGVNNDKIVAAIHGGDAPDVALSFCVRRHGAFWWLQRLDRFARRTSTGTTSASTRSRRQSCTYAEYNGTRCAMPLLADVYGLYYNKDLFQAGRPEGAAEDDLPARPLREEADPEFR